MSERDLSDRPATSAASPRVTARRSWGWLAATGAIALIIDQVTKALVRAAIAPGEAIHVLPGVDLVRARNQGIAFGLFPGGRRYLIVLTLVALGVIALILTRLAHRNRTVAVGGGLLLGGSAGNLLDRLVRGGVTDFLDLSLWPAFNVADIAIVAGAVVIALGLLRRGADAG